MGYFTSSQLETYDGYSAARSGSGGWPRFSPGPGRSFSLLLLIFLFLAPLFSSCDVVMDVEGALTGEERVNRATALDQFRLAILANGQICPENIGAGFYAMDSVLAGLINQSTYIKSTVDGCSAMLMIAPCGLHADTDTLIGTNLYRAILRSCGLRSGDPNL